MATTGAAAEDWELVPHKFATEIGEDRREAGKTCSLLLAVAGGEPSDATAVCQHVGADRWIGASVGIAEATGTQENDYDVS